jgi:hypothetical protein
MTWRSVIATEIEELSDTQYPYPRPWAIPVLRLHLVGSGKLEHCSVAQLVEKFYFFLEQLATVDCF